MTAFNNPKLTALVEQLKQKFDLKTALKKQLADIALLEEQLKPLIVETVSTLIHDDDTQSLYSLIWCSTTGRIMLEKLNSNNTDDESNIRPLIDWPLRALNLGYNNLPLLLQLILKDN